MSEPKFPLGVSLMDEDHAHLEELFEQAAGIPDGDLLDFLKHCRDEIAAHFVREEALMTAQNVPVLHCHIAQHRRLVEDIDAVIVQGALSSAQFLRTYLVRDVPNLVMAHVASVDQVTAHFLRGDLDPKMVEALRLPQEQGS